MPIENILAAVLVGLVALNLVLLVPVLRRTARRDRVAALAQRADASGRGGPASDESGTEASGGEASNADAAARSPGKAREGAERTRQAPTVLRIDAEGNLVNRPPGVGGPGEGFERPESWAQASSAPGTFSFAADAPVSPGTSELDPLTGVDGPLAWERHLSEENARVVRYGRPAAIVLAELVGLRRLSDRFGERQAERLLPAIADVFRREARRCDRVARVGWARFGVLLPETDERQAVTYVERVRAASDRWLAAGGVALRLSVGVASPPPSTGLDSAVRLAEERMYAERRGPTDDDEPEGSAGSEA